MAMNEQLLQFLRALSRLLGWIYTLAWSASFYPQPFFNWQRKSTWGTTVDFPFLNTVGFTCYTVSTTCLLFSPTIRKQYAERHPQAPVPTVRINDLAYNVHAVLLVALTYAQFYPRIWGFQVSEEQRRISRPVALITALCSIGIIALGLIIFISNGLDNESMEQWIWLDLVYAIGYVKLVVTFTKYVPQVWLNYQRKSTSGWSITQILLDVLGGVMSIAQLIIDASIQNNWRDVVDNPIKLGLGYISIFFDLIFIVQHYLLYSPNGENLDKTPGNDRQPLLGHSA